MKVLLLLLLSSQSWAASPTLNMAVVDSTSPTSYNVFGTSTNPIYISNPGITTDGNQFNGAGTAASPLVLDPSSVTLQGNSILMTTLDVGLTDLQGQIDTEATTYVNVIGDTMTGPLVGNSSITATAFYGDGSQLSGIVAGIQAGDTTTWTGGNTHTNTVFVSSNVDSTNGYTIGSIQAVMVTPATSNYFLLSDRLSSSVTGTSNMCIGRTCGALTTGHHDLFIGNMAGYNVTGSGGYNTGIGDSNLRYATNQWNTAVGYQNQIDSLHTGYMNTSFGYIAAGGIRDGYSNTAIGGGAGTVIRSGNNNTCIGKDACYNLLNGNQNTIVGGVAGYSVYANSYGKNTFLGYNTGYKVTTATSCIFVGVDAGSATTTGYSNIYIGDNVQGASITENNKLNIGNLIMGDLTAGTVRIKQSTNCDTLTPSAVGEICVMNSATTPVWISTTTNAAGFAALALQ